MSGLELNADKTEILVCRHNSDDRGNDHRDNDQLGRIPARNQQAMPCYQREMPEYRCAMRNQSNIVSLNDNLYLFKIKYLNKAVVLKSVKSVKICGIVFSEDDDLRKKINIDEKIKKLDLQLKKWRCRNLNILGKIQKLLDYHKLYIKCNACL
jgi:hypothetical protein